MEKIINYIISGVLLYLVKKIFDTAISPKYPKGAEFNLFQKRYKIYKNLYYAFCYDFSKEQEVSKYSFDAKNIEDKIQLFHKEYLKNEELTELLSNVVQLNFRKYITAPNAESFEAFQNIVSQDYFFICEILQYTVLTSSKEEKFGYKCVFYGTCSIALIAILATFIIPNPVFSLISLLLSITLVIALHFQYNFWFKSNFENK